MSSDAPEAQLIKLWHRLSGLPFGHHIYSWLLGRMVPYSGTVRPLVRVLEPGRAVVEMRDRRRVRNHLRSVHAIALCNLGELASGLSMTAALPASVRGIVTGIDIQYRKKARGTLTATSEAMPPDHVTEAVDHPVRAEITDSSGEVVSTVTVHWRLAPRPEAGP